MIVRRIVLTALVSTSLAVACGGGASPSAPTGTLAPTVTASTGVASPATPLVFASTSYRYSITLPAGWVATPASVTWDGQGAPTSESPAVDLFGPPGVTTTSGPAALALAAPTTDSLAAWVAYGIAQISIAHSDTCPKKPDSVEAVTVGGQPGKLVAMNCGILINTAFTVVNGYGYRFGFRDPLVPAATDPKDLATFTTMLGSVMFH